MFHKSIIYSYFSYSFGFSDSATCQEDRILSFFKHTSGFVLRIEENCHMQTYSQLFHLFRLNRRYNLSHRWIIRTFHYDLLRFRVIHLFYCFSSVSGSPPLLDTYCQTVLERALFMAFIASVQSPSTFVVSPVFG